MDFQIRDRSIIQGGKKLTTERAAYLQLMQQGMSNTEASQIVGINPKTGRRWRNGRNATGRNTAAAPIHTVLPPIGPSRYLRENERIHIADLHREGKSVRAIAARRPGVFPPSARGERKRSVVRS